MFITEEILSGVHTCGLQLCFSFPCSRPKLPSSPVCACVCVYLILKGNRFLHSLIPASFSIQLLSEQLCLLVQITFCSPSPICRQAFHPPVFSCRFYRIVLDNLVVLVDFWLSLGSRERAVFVSLGSFFVSPNSSKCLFVLLLLPCDS